MKKLFPMLVVAILILCSACSSNTVPTSVDDYIQVTVDDLFLETDKKEYIDKLVEVSGIVSGVTKFSDKETVSLKGFTNGIIVIEVTDKDSLNQVNGGETATFRGVLKDNEFYNYAMREATLVGSTPTDKKNVGSTEEINTIGVAEYRNAFNENSIAADQNFRNKLLEVTAEIGNITKGDNKVYVTLIEEGFWITCGFELEHMEDILKLKTGDVVTIRGRSRGNLFTEIGDDLGKCTLIYDTANTSGENSMNNATAGEIIYKGQSLERLIGNKSEKLYELFGTPTAGTPVNGDMLYGGTEYYGYDGLCFMLGDDRTIVNIIARSNIVEVNGVTLDKNRTEIINILGEPISEESIPGFEEEGIPDRYIMQYIQQKSKCNLGIELPNPDSISENVTISRYGDGIGDKENKDATATSTSEINIRDLVGEFSYDASSTDPTGRMNDFYYLLEIGWVDSELVITTTWRGNFMFNNVRVSPDSLKGNTLVFDAITNDSTEPQTHSLAFIPAKDSPQGKDTIYIDGEENMPYVRE